MVSSSSSVGCLVVSIPEESLALDSGAGGEAWAQVAILSIAVAAEVEDPYLLPETWDRPTFSALADYEEEAAAYWYPHSPFPCPLEHHRRCH